MSLKKTQTPKDKKQKPNDQDDQKAQLKLRGKGFAIKAHGRARFGFKSK